MVPRSRVRPKTGRMRGGRLSEYMEYMAKTTDKADDRFSVEPEGTGGFGRSRVFGAIPASLGLIIFSKYAVALAPWPGPESDPSRPVGPLG